MPPSRHRKIGVGPLVRRLAAQLELLSARHDHPSADDRARDGHHKLVGALLIVKLDVGDQLYRSGNA